VLCALKAVNFFNVSGVVVHYDLLIYFVCAWFGCAVTIEYKTTGFDSRNITLYR